MKIWILKDCENLPIRGSARIMRAGIISEILSKRDIEVHWFANRFSHTSKANYTERSPLEIKKNYFIHLLDGCGYRRNLSLKRIFHQRAIAKSFTRVTTKMSPPDLILAAYPSPELCNAGRLYCKKHKIPFAVDVRDPWPDILFNSVPLYLKAPGRLLIKYYNSILVKCLNDASQITTSTKSLMEWVELKTDLKDKSREVFYLSSINTPVDISTRVPSHFTAENPLVCSYVSTLGASYDLLPIINTARKLLSVNEQRIKFVIVGQGDMRTFWETQAKELPNIEFKGWLDGLELKKQLLQSHLGMILVSDSVSKFWLGNKLYDYLSHGLGIVSNAKSELKDMINIHSIGVNLIDKNSEELTECLCAFATNPAKVASILSNSFHAYSKYYYADIVYAKFADKLLSKIKKNHFVSQ